MANEIALSDFQIRFNELVEGLLVMSETDAPLKPFVWKKVAQIDDSLLRKKAKASDDAPIEKWTVDDFFKNMNTVQDWHGEEEKADVQKFQNLTTSLQSTLSEVEVYKIGDARKEVFIVGKMEDGNYGGLKTYVVET